ncbi:MAG: ankyrin repeat domain-containing protein [Bacteroidota bacterium]
MKILLFAFATLLSLQMYGQELSASLKEAIKEDNVSMLKKNLIEEDLNVCYPTGKKSYTLLMLATKVKAIHCAKYLAKKSIDIDQVCMDKTALMYAVESDNLELVKILVKEGADAKKESGDWSAIDFAVSHRHHAIRQYFNSLGIYKNYELRGVDGPYVFGNLMYTINQNDEFKQTRFDRTQPIKVEVANEDKDQFEVQLRTNWQEEQDFYPMPKKLIAISDIEGNFNAFQSFLVSNGVINKQYDWTFGDGHLVMVGDFFDRGYNVTAILWLIYDLEAKAEAAGGKVHFILGNHEVMNIQGDIRYVKEKYIAAAQKISEERSIKAAYKQLYSNESELGRWLRTKNSMEKIGTYLFVHAGLHPEILSYDVSIKDINRIIREYIDIDLYRHPSEDMTANFLAGSKGPLWYRGLASDPQHNGKISMIQLQKMLNYYQGTKVVIGHTLMRDILSSYDGKIIKIDVKHGKNKNSGQTKGLLVENGIEYKVDDLGRRDLL